ncbi:MAG TPA: hypothetical protein VLE95_00995 [Chlamydiales bacterium]|nr:hypothetical protein [Chlamydiales bacterium]
MKSDCFGIYTQSDSKVGLWAGSKRRKSIPEKGASIEEYNPLFKNRFSAAFNPAQKPTFESLWVYLFSCLLILFVNPSFGAFFEKEVKICLVMATKNQEAFLFDCLKSVGGLIDAACIIDTGSSDCTETIAREWLEQEDIPYLLTCYQECSDPPPLFALKAARKLLQEYRFALERTYFLWLEGDCILDVIDRFQKNDLKECSYLVFETSPSLQCSTFEKRLLLASVPWMCFEGRHPQWFGLETGLAKKLDGISIHGGYTTLHEEIPSLIENYDRQPFHGRTLLRLAQAYKGAREFETAIELYQKRIDSGAGKEEIWFSKFMIGACYQELKQWDKALHWYLEAHQYCPNLPDPIQKIATYYRESGKNELAFLFADYGRRIQAPLEQTYFDYPSFQRYQFDEEIGITAYYTRFLKEGLEACNRLLVQKNIPYWIRDQNGRNLFFYSPYLENTDFQSIELSLPPVTGDSPESYHPMTLSFVKTENGYKMLCSAINYTQQGRKIFATNDPSGVFRTRNFYLELDKKFQVTFQQEIEEKLIRQRYRPLNVEGLEDVRLFEYQGEDWCLSTTADTNPNGVSQVSLCRFSQGEITQLIPLIGPDSYRAEKNWLPFIHCGALHLIYSYDPFTIYTPDLKTGICHSFLEQAVDLNFSTLRGSAPPISYKEGYLLLVHEIVHYPDSTRAYLHRFLYLNQELKIEKYSHAFAFLHQGIERCYGLNLDHSGKRLIFTVVREDKEAYLGLLPIECMPPLHRI